MDLTFQYKAQIQEIPRIRKDLEFLNKEWKLPRSEISQILVIIEELFSNITRYAFEDKEEHLIDVRLTNCENQIEIEMIDDGIPFNPLDYQLQTPADPTSAETGGMGLTLIKAFSSSLTYERSSGKNHLKIIKRIKSK